MHVFDSPEEKVDTEAKFEKLLEELASAPLMEDASPMYASENTTKWMALAVLCPLPFRDHYKPMWVEGEMSDYDVALELSIPETFVTTVMEDYFPEVVASLTE